MKFKSEDLQVSPDWILGFIEGDGSFCSNNKKYPSFVVFQQDIMSLLFLKKFFNVGSIIYSDKKHGWFYNVCGRNCWPIRDFCEGRLILDWRTNQFENWKQLKRIPFNKREANYKEVNFSDWLIGFIEAEGSFTCSSGKYKYPMFSLAQDDRKILETVKNFFKVGFIGKTGNDSSWEYRVTGRNCWVTRLFCENKLISRKKKAQFKKWKKLRWIPIPSEFIPKMEEKTRLIEVIYKDTKGREKYSLFNFGE
ncbi:MAG: LAGLIDADG family homing endonuclease [Candidatus Aenigmatarchaeota archaeon]